MGNKIYILFVCEDNSIYSQMAEAMVRLYRDDEIIAYSAGISPAQELDKKAIELMERIGYKGMEHHRTKSVNDVCGINFDYVITIGMPTYIYEVVAEKRLEWRFSEIDEFDETQLMRLRDKLLNKVLNFVISVAA